MWEKVTKAPAVLVWKMKRRPAMADGMSKFETVNGPRHVNIRKHHPDVAAALEYL